MITQSGNISVWRGPNNPPTRYHLYLKEDDDNKLALYSYNDEDNDWTTKITSADQIFLGCQSDMPVDFNPEQTPIWFDPCDTTEDGGISYPLSPEDWAKIQKLIINGDGTLYLANDGIYKAITVTESDPIFTNWLTNETNIAIGKDAESVNDSISIGTDATSEVRYSVSIGNQANTTLGGSISLGYQASSSANFSTSIGTLSYVDSSEGSIALGWQSAVTNTDSTGETLGVLSIGNSTNQRRIINVANGITSTDAITKGQLDTKQDILISGITIKTINNESLLGSGNIDISGSGSGPNFVAYPTFQDFPTTGAENTFYLDSSTGNVYYWDGTEYHVVDEGLFSNYLPLSGGTMIGSITFSNTNGIKWTNAEIISDTNNINIITNNGGILEYSKDGGSTLYEVATINELSSYLPLSGGTMTGALTLNNNYLYLGSGTQQYLDVLGSSIKLVNTSPIGNIDLSTTGTGITTYNGTEIATIQDITDGLTNVVINGENPALNINSTGTVKITTSDEDYTGSSIEMTHGSSISPNGQVTITADNLSIFDGTSARRILNNGANVDAWNISAPNFSYAITDITNGNAAMSLRDGTFNVSGGMTLISAGKSVSFQVSGANFSIQTQLNGIATYNGNEIVTVANDNSGIIYVNGTYTGTVETGSSFQPYKTIQAAIDATDNYKNILIAPGTYNESLIFTGKIGLSLKGLSPIGNRPNIEVSGGLIIDETSQRIGIHGLSFDGVSNINSTGSNDYFQFVNFNAAVTIAGTGYTSFRTCWFNGLNWTSGNVEMNTCYDENNTTWTLAGTGYTFGCRNGYGLVISHSGGNVDIVDTFFSRDSSSLDSIYSNANTGRLLLTGGTLQQLDGSYGNITKIGLCDYGLGTLVFEDQTFSGNGTRIDSGLHGTQVYMHRGTPGYTRRTAVANGTITTDSLTAHLLGISDKFVEINGQKNNGTINASGSANIDVAVGDSGITLSLRYQSNAVSNLYAVALDGDVSCSIRRASIYESTAQGSNYSGTLSTTEQLIDDILTDGTDTVIVWIKTATNWYEAKIFSESLFGADIVVTKLK